MRILHCVAFAVRCAAPAVTGAIVDFKKRVCGQSLTEPGGERI